MSKKLRLKLLVVTGSVLVGLFAAEGLIRVFGTAPLQGRNLIIQKSANPTLRYELIPGASGMAFQTPARINSLGFRGPEIKKNKTVPRIAVLGDSITFGNWLREELVYPAQLQRLLQERVEVLNLGVGGYDAKQAVTFLAEKQKAVQPDIVVYGFCVNDLGLYSINDKVAKLATSVGPLIHSALFQNVLRAGEILAGRPGNTQAQSEGELEARYRSEVLPIKNERVLQLQKEIEGALRSLPRKQPLLAFYTSPARVGHFSYVLSQLQKAAQENHFKPYLLIIPRLSSSDKESWERVYEMVDLIAREHGIEPVSVYPEFAEAGLDSLRQKKADIIHPNEKGHELMAQALAERLSSKLINR